MAGGAPLDDVVRAGPGAGARERARSLARWACSYLPSTAGVYLGNIRFKDLDLPQRKTSLDQAPLVRLGTPPARRRIGTVAR